jgi:SAM-dependent methyltransferase
LTNYFAHATAAERYAKSRPFFHPLVVERIRKFLGPEQAVPVALDVACGTGQSTLALTELAESVIATDISPEMLTQAPVHERIRYAAAPAENLPLEPESVDMITVALAFHWFDRARFLAEARRVLRRDGALVIYNNGFYGRMHENPALADWNREQYLVRYPIPPRNNRPFTDEDATAAGFTFAGRERYANDVSFSPEQLARYLMTQSNVIAAVEQGSEPLEAVHAWLLETVTPLFPSPTATFAFGGEIWYLRKSSDAVAK